VISQHRDIFRFGGFRICIAIEPGAYKLALATPGVVKGTDQFRVQQRKDNLMKSLTIRILLLAGIGAIAMMVPATASPTVSGSTHARPVHAIEVQYARTCTATDTDPMCRQTREFYKKQKSSKSKPKKKSEEK
jgi:hypothetical protein